MLSAAYLSKFQTSDQFPQTLPSLCIENDAFFFHFRHVQLAEPMKVHKANIAVGSGVFIGVRGEGEG
jgi:hypothetical protein